MYAKIKGVNNVCQIKKGKECMPKLKDKNILVVQAKGYVKLLYYHKKYNWVNIVKNSRKTREIYKEIQLHSLTFVLK